MNIEIPTKYKNQLNGKTAQQNYNEYKKEMQTAFTITQEQQSELNDIIRNAIQEILS